MMGIDSICSKLLKTVGPLAVRLDLAKLRLKNRKENKHFWLKSESHFLFIPIFFNFLEIYIWYTYLYIRVSHK